MITALRFLLRLQAENKEHTFHPRALEAPAGSPWSGWELDEYYPNSAKNPRRRPPTIVFFHGMSILGKRDKRVRDFCQALCDTGFRVLVPDIPSVRATVIDPNQVDEIATIIQSILARPDLNSSGKLAVVGPSFTGSLLLAAVARPVCRDHISAVLSIGGYSDVEKVADYLLTAPDIDPYGRYIVLKNYLPKIMDFSPALKKALELAISDNFHHHPPEKQELPGHLAKMNKKDRALYDTIINDNDWRKARVADIRKAHAGDFHALQIQNQIDGLRAPVFLLHGADDNVIAPSQSVELTRLLRARRHPVACVLTPFLSHGDSSLHLKDLPEVWKLLRGFQFYFRHTRRGFRRPRAGSHRPATDQVQPG